MFFELDLVSYRLKSRVVLIMIMLNRLINIWWVWVFILVIFWYGGGLVGGVFVWFVEVFVNLGVVGGGDLF